MARIKPNLDASYLEQPYVDDNSPLSRRELAENLAGLYSSLDHSTVSILHGRWGTGKSTFAKKLRPHLRARGITSTYFDAFANDYIENPFLALSAHIFREIELRGNSENEAAKTVKKASAKVGRRLLTTGAKVATKAVTLGLVGAAEIDEIVKIGEDIADASGEISEFAAEQLLERFSKSEAEFDEFKAALGALPAALQEDFEEEVESQEKIVFIIDELDRCRPDFALGVLEILKHLFDEENVHFLLVTNIDYLEKSVNSRYNLGGASKEYLEKFYDFIVFFEDRNANYISHRSSELVGNIIDDILSDAKDKYELKNFLTEFAKVYDLTLRQSVALATNAALAYLVFDDRNFRPTVLVAVLALLRTRFPDTYSKIKRREFELDDILHPFKDDPGFNVIPHDRLLTLLTFYAARDDQIDRNAPEFEGYGGMSWQYNFASFRDVLPFMANSVFDRFSR